MSASARRKRKSQYWMTASLTIWPIRSFHWHYSIRKDPATPSTGFSPYVLDLLPGVLWWGFWQLAVQYASRNIYHNVSDFWDSTKQWEYVNLLLNFAGVFYDCIFLEFGTSVWFSLTGSERFRIYVFYWCLDMQM